MKKTFLQSWTRCLSLIIILAAAVFWAPDTAYADGGGKTVRVGWYESPFNRLDESGRRSGYAYDYQLKLAAYSGWEYEYVSGSWPELMQMLSDGEIDLMSDVSYTEERAKKLLYPELPMGTEEYFIFIAPGSQKIHPGDPASFNGKRIGVNKSSIQADIFRQWIDEQGISPEVVEVSGTEEKSIEMLEDGTLDAFITPDAYGDAERMVPVLKIGSSDFYFAVSGQRPDLLEELNEALSRIQDENPYYNQSLYKKYVQSFGANAFLAAKEREWVKSHGPIRVGYQDNYLAFCASDPETGELTGALKDYLDAASGCLADTRLEFEAVSFPTAADALDALKRGEVDCVFPANFSAYDGEDLGLVMTPALMCTDTYAVVRQSGLKIFVDSPHVIAAVNEGNPNYEMFLREYFPEWKKAVFADTPACLKAVRDGKADRILISNYRFNNISRLCDRYRLTTYNTGVSLDYSFAMKEGETELYSVMAKTVNLVPDSFVNSTLSYYITEDAKRTFADFLMDNLLVVLSLVAAVVVVILLLLFRSMRMEDKARQLILATETDDLTGLYNRDYFFQYANQMYRNDPDIPRDAVVANIEQFHSINALNGREFGDQVLRVLGTEIRSFALDHDGIGGRFGADRFDIYFRHTEDYKAVYSLLQSRLDELAPNVNIRIRMGVMPWQKGIEPVQLFDRAHTACSMARGHYKEHLIVFDEKLREKELLDQRLLNDLRRALDGHDFDVYYQPKYDIQSEPPRLVSAEALIRWKHPELGMIPPDSFIPMLEKNGKIGEVDKYVWGEAARQIARWKAQYGVTIPVSVNLSRVDVFDPELEKTLDGIIRENRLGNDDLKLEVTESAYTENADQVIRVVTGLHDKGYTVEMDDFGTGYSSLSMLSAMPIDVLKMDRTFVRNIEHDKKDIQLVALILGIAKNMDIPVIAEGAETEAQIKLLRELGCAVVQGYFFSKPLPPEEFEARYLRGEA